MDILCNASKSPARSADECREMPGAVIPAGTRVSRRQGRQIHRLDDADLNRRRPSLVTPRSPHLPHPRPLPPRPQSVKRAHSLPLRWQPESRVFNCRREAPTRAGKCRGPSFPQVFKRESRVFNFATRSAAIPVWKQESRRHGWQIVRRDDADLNRRPPLTRHAHGLPSPPRPQSVKRARPTTPRQPPPLPLRRQPVSRVFPAESEPQPAF